MKNIVIEITYSMNGLKRLDRFEDRTSELEEKSKKCSQNSALRNIETEDMRGQETWRI